ncbi:MAG: hypothetical protein IJ272_03035 [Clostridia bacterium]|nr:hypothetical protein [Clostridia bacterium]
MKAKINIKKLIICIILLISIMIMPTFSRYVYNNVRDLYLKSQNFSFSSNLLTTMGKSYKYANWSGADDYELNLQLYSYENELSLFEYEGDGLAYSISCEVEDTTKATAHIETVAGDSTDTGYIPNTTNVKDIKIYLKPTANLAVGDTVKVVVTASTTVPYEKTISATFNIKVTGQGITYSIEDEEASIYANLKLVNTKSETNTLTLSWDPSKVVIDVTHEYYENRNQAKDTYTTVNEVQYVSSITFDMEPEDVKSIVFYKKDINADYTYPGGTATSMIVTITESN